MSNPVIENVSIHGKSKMSQDGTVITFYSEDTVSIGDKFSVTFENKEHYFQAIHITIQGDGLIIQAAETGYYASKFDHKKKFDIRNLMGLEVELITDEAKIAKILTESGWC